MSETFQATAEQRHDYLLLLGWATASPENRALIESRVTDHHIELAIGLHLM